MSEITPAQVEALCSAIKSGSDLDTSCHFAGISNQLVYRWLELGKLESERINAGDKPLAAEVKYLTFWDDLKKARADAIVRNVAFIQKAAQEGNWQAAAWWLERTVPEQYGKNSNTKPKIADNKQIEG